MFKTSHYNFYIPLQEKGEFLLYNSLLNKLFIVEHEIGSIITNWSNKSKIYNSELCLLPLGIKTNLLDEQFIIPFEIDEKEILAKRLLRYRSQENKEIGLTILPTNSCNMSCTYCFENKKEGSMNELTEKELVIFVQDVIDSQEQCFDSLAVVWFGGEPLLLPGILESLSQKLISLCTKNNLNYSAVIITNGVYLTSANWNLMKRCKIKSVQVTIDGNEYLHNKNRPLKSGINSYPIIMENLRIAPKEIQILIRVNIDKEIFVHIEDLFDDLKKYKIWPHRAKQVKIYPGFKQYYENNLDNKSKYFTPEEFSIIEEELRKIKHRKYNQWAENHNQKKSKLSFLYPKLNPLGCKTVNSPTTFVIDCNGNITKCWDDCTNVHKSIHHVSKKYNTLLNNKQFKDIVEFSHFKYDNECYDCKFLPICESGNCIHRHIEEGQFKPCTTWRYKLSNLLKDQYILSIREPDVIQSYTELFQNETNE